MKKIITIISMFLCLFLFSKTQVFAFENENLVITDEKITINYFNNEIVLKSSEKKAYELCDNYNNRICTHIIYNKNIQVDIILYNNIEFNRFYAEILIENEDESNNYANLNEISKNDYTLLIDNAVQINYESAIGIALRTKQTTFEKLYYGKNNDINSYNSDEKTNIENMTNSSSYIDSYYPTPFSETGYTRVYDDNIINIVPKTWFYTVRSDWYIGKEYGIYKNTTVTYNYAFSVKCYKTNVVIWKFDNFVPCMYGNKTNGLFAESEKYKLKIYEKFNYNYCAFMRTDVGETIWNKYFDTREDQIVAQSIDSYDKVYLVPKYSSYGIDNFNNLEDNAFKIRNFSYRLVADADISISDKKLVLGLGKTIFGLAKLLGNSYLEKTLLSLMDDFYTHYLNKKYAEVTYDKILKLNNYLKELNVDFDYSNSYDEDGANFIPEFIFTNFNELLLCDLFKNYNITDYYHEIIVDFSTINQVNDNYYFNFYDNSFFQVVDKNGSIIANDIQRKAAFQGLTVFSNDESNGGKNTINISSDDNLIGNLTKISDLKIVKFNDGGIYRIKSTNKNIGIELYSSIGQVVVKTLKGDFENSTIVKVEPNVIYQIRYFMYDKNSSNFENTTIAIKKITEKETINSNKSILISGTNKKFIELELFRGGVYTFSTSTLSDTTIKLYDSNGNLLRESYDPNADYSEDNPDLNANMTFYSRGRSRIVFLEVSIDYIENFYLDVSYYTD